MGIMDSYFESVASAKFTRSFCGCKPLLAKLQKFEYEGKLQEIHGEGVQEIHCSLESERTDPLKAL